MSVSEKSFNVIKFYFASWNIKMMICEWGDVVNDGENLIWTRLHQKSNTWANTNGFCGEQVQRYWFLMSPIRLGSWRTQNPSQTSKMTYCIPFQWKSKTINLRSSLMFAKHLERQSGKEIFTFFFFMWQHRGRFWTIKRHRGAHIIVNRVKAKNHQHHCDWLDGMRG